MIGKIRDRLVAVREALDINQRDFCKGIFVSQPYYAQIESETRPISDRIIALVCSQYGVSKEYLLTGRGKMFSDNMADLQLQQLMDTFTELDPPFRDYVILQMKQLVEAVKKQKERPSARKNKKPPQNPE